MTWLIFALSAYIVLAVGNIADKFLLDKVFPNTKTYAFLIGIIGMVLFILAPWTLQWPGAGLFVLDVLAGLIFMGALLMLFKALHLGEVSKVIVLIGGSTPIFTLLLSLFILGERFNYRQWWAIVLMITGTMMISWMPKAHDLWSRVRSWFKLPAVNYWHGIWLGIGAAFLFSCYFVLSKHLYVEQPFLSAFTWMRLGVFLAALVLIINPKERKSIFKGLRHLNLKERTIFVGTQSLTGLGFILQNYAIVLGSVVLVTALQAFQYAVILVVSSLVTIFFPKIIKEKITKFIIFQKVAAIIMVSLGLYFIASA